MIYDTTDKNNFETNDAPYEVLNHYSYQKTELNAIQKLLFIAIRHLVYCYPNTILLSYQTSSF